MRGIKKREQYVTISIFEKAMKNIAARLDAIERVLKTTMRELAANREDHERFRNTLLLHDREITEHDRFIEGIQVRLSKSKNP